MPWRVVSSVGYTRYAQVCRDCSLHRGWLTKQSAQRHVSDLASVGVDAETLYVGEYVAGDDNTCSCHGGEAEATIPASG